MCATTEPCSAAREATAGRSQRKPTRDSEDSEQPRVSIVILKSFQSERLRSKRLQAVNAGEGVEKREPSYTVGGKAI